VFVSRPFNSRVSNGEPSIAISRRLSTPEGVFKGIAVGVVRLAYFEDLISKLDLGPHGTLRILRSDGRVLARYPVANVPLELDLSTSDIFKRLSSEPDGQFTGTSVTDHVDRLFTFRHIGTLPLIISVGTAIEDIYAGWWRKASVIGALLLTLCSVSIALSVLFRREMLRRVNAEAALTQSAARLTVMAVTAGLTGIGNRRAFDLELTRVWRTAVRSQTPVSLLMVDAEYFKRFNDTQGHPAGDQVFCEIAACVERWLRRPTDLAARYGGEEFVALLPDTEEAGARDIAASIRAAIAGLAIPHPASEIGYVSVSIGVAVAYPQHGQNAEWLVTQADEALFRAKLEGRNRVVCAASPFLTIDGSGRTHADAG